MSDDEMTTGEAEAWRGGWRAACEAVRVRPTDYQRDETELGARARLFLSRQPCPQDPRSELHRPPLLPTQDDWSEALFLLRQCSGRLAALEGALARLSAERIMQPPARATIGDKP